MKYLILSLMLAFPLLAQTKFIKEYHYKFIVDKNISAETVDSLVSVANSALENVDRDGYGFRMVNDGIQDTLSLGNDYYILKDSLVKLRETDYLAYITKEHIKDKYGKTTLGSTTRDLRALYVVLDHIEQSGLRFAHEGLHNGGAGHSPESKGIMTSLLADDLMSAFARQLHSYVYFETKQMIWGRLLNTQFYDFNAEP